MENIFLIEDLKDDAKKYFGTTSNDKFAIYINTDGTLLDGSGIKLGNTYPTGRAVDHREVAHIFAGSISGVDAMTAYMNEGNIRWMPESPGIELIKEPTEQQYETLEKLMRKYYNREFYIDFADKDGFLRRAESLENGAKVIPTLKQHFKIFAESYLKEEQAEKLKTIIVEVENDQTGTSFQQELNVINNSIKDTLEDCKKRLGKDYYITFIDKGEAEKIEQPAKKEEPEKYKQLSIFDIREKLQEDTRAQLMNKSKNVDNYKDQTFGKNRWVRKNKSKVANQVKSFNQIDMNKLFKQDELELKVEVIGETNTYDVVLIIPGVLKEITNNLKRDNYVLEFKTIMQAVIKAFNTNEVRVSCNCSDFKFHYLHNLILNKNAVEGSDKDPGPGTTGITAEMKGQGCKHILLVLSNEIWINKLASVIKNYIFYTEEHASKAFQQIIFPKLYGTAYDESIDANLVDDDVKLETEKHIIEKINEWAKNKGKIQKGSNKNPAAGKGKLNLAKNSAEKEKEEIK